MRVLLGVLIAVPAVALLCIALLFLSHFVSLAAMLAGVGLITATELHWRWPTALGGLLLWGGVLAWALVT
jgi:hypothetical protein